MTGSLNGVLRMYYPAQNEYKIEHLLLEENLRRPILQIELGYFVPYVVGWLPLTLTETST